MAFLCSTAQAVDGIGSACRAHAYNIVQDCTRYVLLCLQQCASHNCSRSGLHLHTRALLHLQSMCVCCLLFRLHPGVQSLQQLSDLFCEPATAHSCCCSARHDVCQCWQDSSVHADVHATSQSLLHCYTQLLLCIGYVACGAIQVCARDHGKHARNNLTSGQSRRRPLAQSWGGCSRLP